MKKKSIIIMMLAIMAVFVACGKNTGSKNETNMSENAGGDESKVEASTQEVVNVSKISIGELTEEVVRNYPVSSANDFEYEVDGEGIKIKKYVGDDTIVVIPNAIEGKNVTAISMLVFGNDSEVRGVYFPETITIIKGTFTNNDSLEVVICEGVESVEFNAFNNCPNLHTFISGENFLKIGDSAFAQCVALKQINIPEKFSGVEESTAGTAFLGCTNLTIIGESGSTIEAYAKEHGINFQAK